MAEIAVSFAVDQLFPLLREEAHLLKGIHKEFADIKTELECIQAFLKDADKRAAAEGDNSSEGVKIWVKQVRQAAFRIQDIIDEYIIYVEEQSHERSFHKMLHLFKTLNPRHRIASEIQDIKLCVRGIKDRSERYGFQVQPSFEQGSSSTRGNQNVQWHDPRIASLFIEDAEVVGFEVPRAQLIDWLIKGRPERTVVSVVGMGGQGKTTLTKKVFDSKEVIEHFDCRAWITVSQSYTKEGLLREMLRKFCKENKEIPPHDILQMDLITLIDEVRKFLQRKRYVVVFDDVWNTNFWYEIEHAVTENKNGSRIFITTRNMDVVLSCKNSSYVLVHKLEPLTPEKSVELFYKNAFRFDFNGCCPKDLEDISSEIVDKCNGLPLAIVLIGGLLSSKEKNALEWKTFSQNLSSKLGKDSHLVSITKILGFSYDDLPYYLKSCLLYFGIYPEDYVIKSGRLIRQWIAEGFVKEEKGKTLEEVAKGYLTDLVSRSLVQVSSFTIDGKAKQCRVHDLIHDMILKKTEDLNFCQHVSEDDGSFVNAPIRRLSIRSRSYDLLENIESSQVRSLLIFNNGPPRYFPYKILKIFKLLKVLYFEGADFVSVERTVDASKELENLIHLKYLRFRNVYFYNRSGLGKSISKLHNLETLDIRSILIPKIKIANFRKLRHLFIDPLTSIQWKEGIGDMTSLQTLKILELKDNRVEVLRNMRQLRDLSLSGVNRKNESVVCSTISEMQHLEKLSIFGDLSSSSALDLCLTSYPPILRKLCLYVRIVKLPEWIPKLQNLVELVLQQPIFTDDPLKSLQNMPNLLSLSIQHKLYDGEEGHFQEGGFQKLKHLSIDDWSGLNSLIIDRGALPSLKILKLSMLDKLKTVPSGIQYLDKLEEFSFWGMSNEFNMRIATGGQDNWIIKHVPLVKGRCIQS